ncbi:MAG: 23S rRNA (uracil(1939)-C(5))-methyltransferase RlmD [Bacteroidota bacterium]
MTENATPAPAPEASGDDPNAALTTSALKRGKEVEITLTDFADRGKSLARIGAGDRGYVVFVAGAVPGDRMRARVFKRKRSFAEARILEVLEPSPLRVEPRCEYFSSCGGCKWQHVGYETQLEMKREMVEGALRHEGGIDLATHGASGEGVEVRPTLAGGDEPYYYRNKMEFSFSAQRWLTDWEIASGETLDKDFAIGLHVPGRYDKVLDLKACYLQSEWSARLVNGVREFAKHHGWRPWNVHEHTGYLRHLVVRTPAHTDEKMVNLVTSGEKPERMEAFASWLRAEFPSVTTLVNTINSGKAQTAFGEKEVVVFGPGVVHDRIGEHTFEIAPSAFFQTNTRGAETLYAVAAEMGHFQPTDLVYDLYCGAGTISMYIADQVDRVVGVELVEAAVENARVNTVENGVDNCTFVAGDMLKLFTPDFVAEHGQPDVLLVDPPRAGMHPKVTEQIAALRPERIVYVSCNPRTQAKDLQRLLAETDNGYRIEAIQPVDMFPHTHHVENVIGLRRIDGAPAPEASGESAEA